MPQLVRLLVRLQQLKKKVRKWRWWRWTFRRLEMKKRRKIGIMNIPLRSMWLLRLRTLRIVL